MLGKFETMATDISHLLERIPRFSQFVDMDDKINPTEQHQIQLSGREMEEYHYSQLSHEQRKGLCEMFKWDFLMFGYDCWLSI